MLHFQFTAMFAQNLCMIISMKVECRILACKVHYASTPDSKGTIIRKKTFSFWANVSRELPVWLLTAPDRTGQHRTHNGLHWAHTGPEMTDYFTSIIRWRIKRRKTS